MQNYWHNSDLRKTLLAFKQRDPAARNLLEVALVYPGFHALMLHRLAHLFWQMRLRLIARVVGYIARLLTQIEIHPAARIGKGLVIDHGSGVVIGETATIGNDVTIYQSVTLGGISPAVNSKRQRNIKRHPTIKNKVIVGAGAMVLGPVTVGTGASIGANAVVTTNVPDNTVFSGVPAMVQCKTAGFHPYGTPAKKVPRTISKAPTSKARTASTRKAPTGKARTASTSKAPTGKASTASKAPSRTTKTN